MKKSCNVFRDKWTNSAQAIVEAAKNAGKKKVQSLLSSSMYQNMTPGIGTSLLNQLQFTKPLYLFIEMCSRAALELLPYLVPGKGRGDKAARHLVDSRLVSYKMNTPSHRYNYLTKFFIYRNLQTWKNQSVKSQDLPLLYSS